MEGKVVEYRHPYDKSGAYLLAVHVPERKILIIFSDPARVTSQIPESLLHVGFVEVPEHFILKAERVLQEQKEFAESVGNSQFRRDAFIANTRA